MMSVIKPVILDGSITQLAARVENNPVRIVMKTAVFNDRTAVAVAPDHPFVTYTTHLAAVDNHNSHIRYP